MAEIESLYRFPVKGLSPQKLSAISITAGEGFIFDRFWAIENGTHDFDENNPRFFPKKQFLQLARFPKLAQLVCNFQDDSQTLKITYGETELASGVVSTKAGRQAIENGIAQFMADQLDGKPRLVSAKGHHFSDIPQKAISLINVATVNEIAKAAGKKISPLRFRGNICVTGLEPWEEMEWEGKQIAINGTPLFDVFAITGRCPATKVNLKTGERDIEMLDVLNSNFGHTKCGVYMSAIDHALIKPGDRLDII